MICVRSINPNPYILASAPGSSISIILSFLIKPPLYVSVNECIKEDPFNLKNIVFINEELLLLFCNL